MDESCTVRALSPKRKVIAARMAEAKRAIPHFRLEADIDVDAIFALRKQLRERVPDADVVPSLNDLLIKACAGALVEVPAVNIQYVDDQIREFRSADIAVVIALADGLATPIVRDADRKTVWEIAAEVKALGARAANNTLKMHEIVGGSFSISNLGMHGVDRFDGIINAPQCAILAVGAAKPRVVVLANQQPAIATVMTVTLSVDHRAIDGSTGAAFLSALKRRIEQPQDGLV